MEGFKFALQQDYPYILTMDTDFSHTPNYLVVLHNTCKQFSCRLVIGSPVHHVHVINWPMSRVLPVL